MNWFRKQITKLLIAYKNTVLLKTTVKFLFQKDKCPNPKFLKFYYKNISNIQLGNYYGSTEVITNLFINNPIILSKLKMFSIASRNY